MPWLSLHLPKVPKAYFILNFATNDCILLSIKHIYTFTVGLRFDIRRKSCYEMPPVVQCIFIHFHFVILHSLFNFATGFSLKALICMVFVFLGVAGVFLPYSYS